MSENHGEYPREENLGKNCMFWNVWTDSFNCALPKAELQGRTSCEGIIDDVCLFIKIGRIPTSLTEEQQTEIKTRIPAADNRFLYPPGSTT